MRDKLATCEVINGLTGQLISQNGTTANTAVGPSFDTNGFKELLMVVTVGQVAGTGGTNADFYVRLQESDTIDAVTTGWSAINDGMVSGTAVTTYMALIATTSGAAMANTGLYMTKFYERLNDGVRKRFIRPTAYIVGTAALVKCAYSIALIMSRAQDTGLYVANPTVVATGTSEFSSWAALVRTAL